MKSGLKIRTAAPEGTSPLCHTCKSGLVLRGAALSEEAIFCDYGSPLFAVPFRVRECSGYTDREQAPLYEMQDAAKVIEVTLARAAGFRDPQDQGEE